ncbi:MAG: hypothetical protein J6C64_00570 [Lachnospiraceae bacterium]|nr:hypothetical protein [Lachnospiraceae bacterium]
MWLKILKHARNIGSESFSQYFMGGTYDEIGVNRNMRKYSMEISLLLSAGFFDIKDKDIECPVKNDTIKVRVNRKCSKYYLEEYQEQ